MSARVFLCAVFLCAVLAAAFLAAPVHAELSTLWSACTGKPDVKWEQQIKSCTAIIESKAETQANLAVAYNRRGRAWQESHSSSWEENQASFERAVADYTEAIRLDPNYADAYYNRGTILQLRGDRDELDRVIADYTEVIRLDPNHAAAHRGRADAWATKRDLDRAIADYTEAIRLEPNHPLSYWRRATTWLDKGEFDRAIADLNMVIRLEPKNAGAYADRGSVYAAMDNFVRAIADYTQAIRLDPDGDLEYHTERGYTYFLSGNFSAAAADFHRAVARAPRHPYAWNRVLFRYIARARAGQDARAELARERLNVLEPVVALFLGRGSPGAALKDDSFSDNQCLVEFFVGQWHLIHGDRAAARRHLTAAAANACKESQRREHRAANIELKRMGR